VWLAVALAFAGLGERAGAREALGMLLIAFALVLCSCQSVQQHGRVSAEMAQE
jgi:uncharacterized membrane protein